MHGTENLKRERVIIIIIIVIIIITDQKIQKLQILFIH
jgi:hypothetical protein